MKGKLAIGAVLCHKCKAEASARLNLKITTGAEVILVLLEPELGALRTPTASRIAQVIVLIEATPQVIAHALTRRAIATAAIGAIHHGGIIIRGLTLLVTTVAVAAAIRPHVLQRAATHRAEVAGAVVRLVELVAADLVVAAVDN